MNLATYQRLKKEASHDKTLPEWREKAFTAIRGKISHDKKKQPLAAESLVKLSELMEKLGDREKFVAKVKSIREDLKRRRSFIAELNRCGLP